MKTVKEIYDKHAKGYPSNNFPKTYQKARTSMKFTTGARTK